MRTGEQSLCLFSWLCLWSCSPGCWWPFMLLGCTAGLCSSLYTWFHGAFSVKQLPCFYGSRGYFPDIGLYSSTYWISVELFLQLGQVVLMVAWLSSILTVLPKLGVICISDKQLLLQIIDKDVKMWLEPGEFSWYNTWYQPQDRVRPIIPRPSTMQLDFYSSGCPVIQPIIS